MERRHERFAIWRERRLRRLRSSGLVALAALLLAIAGPRVTGPAAQEASGSPARLTIRHGLMTLEARDAPLIDVLRVVGERASVKLSIHGDVTARVTESVSDVPIEEGVARLLRGHNVIFVFSSPQGAEGMGVLTEIRVYGAATGAAGAGSRGASAGSGSPLRAGVSRALDMPERAIRQRAVAALGRRGGEGAASDLARILGSDTDPMLRAQSATVLGRVGGGVAAAALRAALKDDSPIVRIEAVRALAVVEGDRAIAPLSDVLAQDPDARVRRWAAQVLGGLPGDMARQALSAATSDRDESVRREATARLARRSSPPAVPR